MMTVEVVIPITFPVLKKLKCYSRYTLTLKVLYKENMKTLYRGFKGRVSRPSPP